MCQNGSHFRHVLSSRCSARCLCSQELVLGYSVPIDGAGPNPTIRQKFSHKQCSDPSTQRCHGRRRTAPAFRQCRTRCGRKWLAALIRLLAPQTENYPVDNFLSTVNVATAESDPLPVSGSPQISVQPDLFSWSRVTQIGSSFADQALAVGGMFLANIVLARVQSKEEYGMFALSYSVYTFIAGVHNALILEPYSIHGGGRYHDRFSTYSRHMSRNNALLGAGLAATLSCVWLLLRHYHASVASRSFLGLAFAAPVLLSALFIRRTLYLRRRPDLAARFT